MRKEKKEEKKEKEKKKKTNAYIYVKGILGHLYRDTIIKGKRGFNIAESTSDVPFVVVLPRE